MKIKSYAVWLVLLLIIGVNNQTLQYDGHIETRKLSLFGPDSGFQYSELNQTHNFLFQRTFNNVPRIGLSVYTINFQYSPQFSCQITSATNQTSASILVISQNSNVNNILYIMYITTDHEQIGIFVPEQLNTTDLSVPGRTKNVQSFDFNFKQEISVLANTSSDITTSVYLTGISTTSQMTTNGFSTNRTSVSLRIISSSAIFYSIEVSINSDYTEVLINWVMCTVVYFIPNIMINNRYQMNGGVVTLRAYGGTLAAVTQSIDFLPLTPNDKFEDLNFFLGISTVDCKDGESITLLGVEKYYTDSSNYERLLLQMQTWKLTFIVASSFNYFQFNSLKCSQPGSNCNSTCSKDLRPYFIVSNVCNYCHYSCLTCDSSNTNTKCDTCDVTRTLNANTSLCDCKVQYYNMRTNYTCGSCFPCETCEKANSCTSCLTSENMVLNPITSQCLCKAGFYGNFLNASNNQSYSPVTPCLKCSQNCLYCTSFTDCKACDMDTYLLNGSCIPNCNVNQRFISANNSCSSYLSDLFDQQGRLSFDWSLTTNNNEMIINLVFSQPIVTFYYYENQQGYTYADYAFGSDGSGGGEWGTNVYYDDGLYFAGYTGSDRLFDGGNLKTNHNSNSFDNSTSSLNLSSSYRTVDQSALQGQYYGYGQKTFFQLLYQNVSTLYRDSDMLPYGKYNLTTSTYVGNQNYIDALSRNLVVKISGQSISYTIEGLSFNQFILRLKLTKTYVNVIAALEIKNQGLIRSGNTTVQQSNITNLIERFDFYTQQQITTALSLQSSNQIFVDILWGMSKYFLFIGFGWPFIPLMLALQITMSFNYINSNIPLNLKYFLFSFRDFRNPSILYSFARYNFDLHIFSHQNIYISIPQFEVFDRGIDFMKNSFEFFFVPFLACVLFGVLFFVNFILKIWCNRDFTLISKYIVPRAPLLISGYTLVQALPVSFFFFAQLKDTTFRHPLEPSPAYPMFNTAMAYLAFFLTCAVPILLLAWLYYHFNYGTRITQFSDANIFNRKFLNKIDNQSGQFNRARLEDPLWGGDTSSMRSYMFGAALFGLLIVFGFFLAFFITSFGWQITGLLVFAVLFLVLIIGAKFLKDKVIKWFFIIFMALMIGYLLLHAGLGSNRSIGTYGQWNTAYLGIGLIYAFIITALTFSVYLMYQLLQDMYNKGKQYGWWVNVDKKNDIVEDRKEVKRVTEYRKDTRLKSTFLRKSKLFDNNIESNMNVGNNNNLNNHNKDAFYTSNLKKLVSQGSDYILPSQERMIARSYNRSSSTQNYQPLIFMAENHIKKEVTFFSKDKNNLYVFSQQNGSMLLQRQPLYVDDESRIYDKHKTFIDFYTNLSRKMVGYPKNVLSQQIRTESANPEQKFRSPQQLGIENVGLSIPSYSAITANKEIFLINDEEYEKVGEEKDGELKLKSLKTGELKPFTITNMKKISSSLLKNNSNSELKEDMNMGTLRQSLENNIMMAKKEEQALVLYQDEEYESYGVDEQGRHRLYNSKQKEFITISDNEFKIISASRRPSGNADNLLMLQSAINSLQQLESSNSKVVRQLQEHKTQQIISSLSSLPNHPLMSVEQKTSIAYQNHQLNSKTHRFEEIQQDDAINPDQFYNILGIPSEKVTDFEFNSKDVYLTQRSIKGNEVMQKIQDVQEKYPHLLLLIRNQLNDSEFWIR